MCKSGDHTESNSEAFPDRYGDSSVRWSPQMSHSLPDDRNDRIGRQAGNSSDGTCKIQPGTCKLRVRSCAPSRVMS